MTITIDQNRVIEIKEELADAVDAVLSSAAEMEKIVDEMKKIEEIRIGQPEYDNERLEDLTTRFLNLRNEILPKQQQEAARVYKLFQVGSGQPIAQENHISIKPESPIIDFPTAELNATTKAEMEEMTGYSDQAFEFIKNAPQSFLRLIGDNFVEILEKEYGEHMALAISFDMGKTYEDAKKELMKGALTQEWIKEIEIADSIAPHLRHDAAGKRLARLPITDDDKVLFSYFEGKGKASFMAGANYPWALLALNMLRSLHTRNVCISKGSEKAPNVMAILKAAMDKAIERSMVQDAAKNGASTLEIMGAVEAFGPHQAYTKLMEVLKRGLFQVGYGKESEFRCPKTFDITGMVCSHSAAQSAAELRGPRTTTAERGGNAPVAVDVDSLIDKAQAEKWADIIYAAATNVNGERCTSARRVFLIGDDAEKMEWIREALMKRFSRSAEEVGLGNPLRKGTKLGPNYDKSVPLKINEVTEAAMHDSNAVIATSKSPYGMFSGGRWLMPKLILWNKDGKLPERQTHHMEHEIFGLVLQAYQFMTMKLGIKFGNQTIHHLASSTLSNNEQFHAEFRNGIRAGEQSVNDMPNDFSPQGNHTDPDDSLNGGRNALIRFVCEKSVKGLFKEIVGVVRRHSRHHDVSNARQSAGVIADYHNHLHNAGEASTAPIDSVYSGRGVFINDKPVAVGR